MDSDQERQLACFDVFFAVFFTTSNAASKASCRSLRSSRWAFEMSRAGLFRSGLLPACFLMSSLFNSMVKARDSFRGLRVRVDYFRSTRVPLIF